MAKCLFFIASHVRPNQVLRLIKSISATATAASFLVHHDGTLTKDQESRFGEIDGCTLCDKRFSVRLAAPDRLTMNLYCMQWALHNSDFEWMIFLSGQDYPIRPISELESFLSESEASAYLLGTKAEQQGLLYRYRYQFYELPRFKYGHHVPRWLNVAANELRDWVNRRNGAFHLLPQSKQMGPQLGIKLASPFNADFQCWKGSDWYNFSREAVQYILNEIESSPALLRWYKRTVLPSESLFHTLLFNQDSLSVKNDNLRYIDWGDHADMAWHPKTLTERDTDRILASDKFFARKFNEEVDDTVLAHLDRELGIS